MAVSPEEFARWVAFEKANAAKVAEMTAKTAKEINTRAFRSAVAALKKAGATQAQLKSIFAGGVKYSTKALQQIVKGAPTRFAAAAGATAGGAAASGAGGGGVIPPAVAAAAAGGAGWGGFGLGTSMTISALALPVAIVMALIAAGVSGTLLYRRWSASANGSRSSAT